ncbi:MAG: kinase-like domain-containing protein [Monoraphidium minutum]|nr:MAG: kinase-like domain-containing protein [Monoraphidium minutum]
MPHSIGEGGQYEFVQDIGKGSFGSVVLAKHMATGELVAIKRLERAMVNRHYVSSEILNHSGLCHPHVVQFREVFLSRSSVNIVMEYAAGGSLLAYVQRRGRLYEPAARWFFQQLVLAVDFCHKQGVANRDIKLDNLLLQPIPGATRPLLKVCDFGYSRADARAHAFSKVGTLSYIAPEVLGSRDGYNARVADVWSCGVVLYAMLVGGFPYATPAPGAGQREAKLGLNLMLRDMQARRLEIPSALGLSGGAASLLRRLLDPDPRRRVSVADILQDPWFLTDLPTGALTMAARCLGKRAARAQPEAEIQAVVDAVRGRGASDGSDEADAERIRLDLLE